MNVQPLTPVTSVRVLSGIPFSSTYTDTLFFSSVSAQTNYFLGKTKYSFNDLTTVRLQNKIRLPKPADNIYNCNYLMFRNTNFGQKWFYAFITAVDYININMCEVTIEIDPLQTWFFECQSYKQRQYILRETPPTGEYVGQNIEPENIQFNEYVANGVNKPIPETPLYVVLATYNTSGDYVAGKIVSGIYQGLNYYWSTNHADINTLISDLNELGKGDSIVAVIQTVAWLLSGSVTATAPKLLQYTLNMGDDLDGYTPRRKKLFTYPYYMAGVTGCNSFNIYKYEYFNSVVTEPKATFNIYGCASATPSFFIAPTNYKGYNSDNLNEAFEYPAYCQCAYTTDTFKAWMAQNSFQLVGSALTSIIGAAAAVPTGGLSLGLLSSGISTGAQVAQESIKPPKLGSTQNYSAYMAMKNSAPIFSNYSVPAEMAQTIDWYFEKYGYAENKIKLVHASENQYWHYVQTQNANFTGDAANDDLAKINKIFDNGVRFWYNDSVGVYTKGN